MVAIATTGPEGTGPGAALSPPWLQRTGLLPYRALSTEHQAKEDYFPALKSNGIFSARL